MDHSHDTCKVAEKNGTSENSATCWDIGMADAEKAKCMKTPIDVSQTKAGSAAGGPSPVFGFKSVEEVIVHPSKYTLDVTVPDHGDHEHGTFGHMLVNGRNFLLRKISVKPISSHTYDGIHHVGEVQIEGILFGDEIDTGAGHRRLASSSAGLHRVILSVPIKLGGESALLRQIGLPFEAYRGTIKNGNTYNVRNTVDLKAGVQPALDGKWLWYSGGLATPGCSDWGVRWLLFETAIEASLEQLNFLDLKVSGTDSTRPHGNPMSDASYKSLLPAWVSQVLLLTCTLTATRRTAGITLTNIAGQRHTLPVTRVRHSHQSTSSRARSPKLVWTTSWPRHHGGQ